MHVVITRFINQINIAASLPNGIASQGIQEKAMTKISVKRIIDDNGTAAKLVRKNKFGNW